MMPRLMIHYNIKLLMLDRASDTGVRKIFNGRDFESRLSDRYKLTNQGDTLTDINLEETRIKNRVEEP